MNEIKLIRNKGTGGDIALQLPQRMSGGELQKWVYANSERIKKAKKEMKKRDLDEYVLETIPDRSYTPKLGEFAPDEVILFEKRIAIVRKHGDDTIVMTEEPKHDHEWNSGFVEYLIDRYEYTYIAGNLIIHINHKKDENSKA